MGLLRRRRESSPPESKAAVGLVAPGTIGRVKEADRTLRRPLEWWDRIKLLLLLMALFGALWLQEMGDNPIKSAQDAFWDTASTFRWLALLMGLEIVRQLHFVVAEHWSGYYLFWRKGVFGRVNNILGRINPWVRYRVARAIKWVLIIAIVGVVLGNIYDQAPLQALVELPSRFWDWLPFVFQLMFGFLFVTVQFLGIFWLLSRGGIETYFPEDIDTRFDDVWGQDHVVEKVKENLIFLEDPESIESRGGYTPGGILLWGPPGTGKTLLAEAAAGETGKPFVFVDPGAFINMFFGIGIIKVKRLFRKLRKLALKYGGVVAFFDEADALGSRGSLVQQAPGGGTFTLDLHEHDSWIPRNVHEEMARWEQRDWGSDMGDPEPPRRSRIIMAGMGGGGGGMGTLQALLTELSGLKKPRGVVNRHVRKLLGMRPKPPPNYRILVMMATNMPNALDEALLRPGRLDRIYRVGYPSTEGRIRTYKGYFGKIRHELTDEDIEKLATITPNATGASIKDLVNESLIYAIRDGRETVTWVDVLKAKQLKQLGPKDDVKLIDRDRHAIAVHEACHAVAAYHRLHDTIELATIEPGSGYLGMVSRIKSEDSHKMWRSDYEGAIEVSLASLAGERMFYDGDNASGVSGDLEQATRVATFMEGFWGMGQTLSSHGVTQQAGIGGGRPKFPGEDDEEEREKVQASLGDRIEENLARLFADVEMVLTEHRLQVLALAHALEVYGTLSGEDVVAVLEGTKGPVVDGRVYTGDDFAATLEDYHRSALDAHRARSRVEPLPELSLPAGVVDEEQDEEEAAELVHADEIVQRDADD
jgi:ATP-dependent Zn protease